MSDRPTDKAKEHFGYALNRAYDAKNKFSTLKGGNKPIPADDHQLAEISLATAIQYLAWGLTDLSAGLRATYMLLDEVNSKLPKS